MYSRTKLCDALSVDSTFFPPGRRLQTQLQAVSVCVEELPVWEEGPHSFGVIE